MQNIYSVSIVNDDGYETFLIKGGSIEDVLIKVKNMPFQKAIKNIEIKMIAFDD
jgi:hypothetical protein